jgi:uncharacterized protein
MGKSAEKRPDFGWCALKLSVVMAVVFVFTSLFPGPFEPLILDSSKVLSQPWTLVTYMFIHGNYAHISSNLFVLLLFGLVFEKVAGSENFLIVFFLTGIVSGVAGTLFYGSMIGASGAIFGVIGALTLIAPRMVLPAFGIPVPLAVAAMLWLALDIGGAFYPSSVGNIGHIAGLLCGAAIGIFLRPKYKTALPERSEKAKLDEDYFRWWEENYLRPANVRKRRKSSS